MKPLRVRIPKALVSPDMERRIKIALDAGLGQRPDVDVAFDLGASMVTVARYRRIIGLGLTIDAIRASVGRNKHCKPDEELAQEIRQFAGRGYSRSAIALRLHTVPKRIERVAKAFNISLPKFTCGPRRGSARGSASAGDPPAPKPGTQKRWRAYSDGTFGTGAERVDWTQRDEEIAQKMHVLVRTVREWRMRLRLQGQPIPLQPHKPSHRRPDWREIDWHLTSGELAKKFHVEVSTVLAWRHDFRAEGHPVPPATNPRKQAWLRKVAELAPRVRKLAGKGLSVRGISLELRLHWCTVRRIAEDAGIQIGTFRPPVDWNTVDWSKSNREIAAAVGESRRKVGAMRSELRRTGLQIPYDSADPIGRWRGKGREMEEEVRRLAKEGLYLTQIARALGITPQTIRRTATRAGIAVPSGRSWRKGRRQLEK